MNALLVAGSTLAYQSGGFGIWELVYPAVATEALRFLLVWMAGWVNHRQLEVIGYPRMSLPSCLL